MKSVAATLAAFAFCISSVAAVSGTFSVVRMLLFVAGAFCGGVV
jgi:hypothetical protein